MNAHIVKGRTIYTNYKAPMFSHTPKKKNWEKAIEYGVTAGTTAVSAYQTWQTIRPMIQAMGYL